MTTTGHFSRVKANWAGALGRGDCLALDQQLMQAICGDAGGCWAPTTPIIVSGATFGLFLTGPLRIVGPSATLKTQGASRFVCAVGDFPILGDLLNPATVHAGTTRTIKSSILRARGIPYAQLVPSIAADGTFHGEMQTVSYATQAWNADGPTPTTFLCPIEVHHFSTIVSVTFSFASRSTHATVPTPPKARVMRVDTYGTAAPLTSMSAGADSSGWVAFPTPSSATLYDNGGAFNSWTVTCDQNNLANNSSYTYHVEVIEEQNGQVTPILQPVDLVTDAQANVFGSLPYFGTLAPFVGARVLYKDQPDPTSNGVYMLPGNGSGGPGLWGTQYRPDDLSTGATPALGTQISVAPSQTRLSGATFALCSTDDAPTVGVNASPNWAKSTPMTVGAVVAPTCYNGFWYQCVTAGTTGTTEPKWPVHIGATVSDGSALWTTATANASTLFWGVIGMPGAFPLPAWAPSIVRVVGDIVVPTVANGYEYICGASGASSGTVEPTWPTTPGAVVTENGVAWWCFAIPQQPAATPNGNVWGDIAVQVTGILTLMFQ